MSSLYERHTCLATSMASCCMSSVMSVDFMLTLVSFRGAIAAKCDDICASNCSVENLIWSYFSNLWWLAGTRTSLKCLLCIYAGG